MYLINGFISYVFLYVVIYVEKTNEISVSFEQDLSHVNMPIIAKCRNPEL